MDKRFAVILAGKGTRMSQSYTKYFISLRKTNGRACGRRSVKAFFSQASDDCRSWSRGRQRKLGDRSEYALQEEQLRQHMPSNKQSRSLRRKGTTIVICGDTPLLTETMEAMLSEHQKHQAKVTILTARAEDPTGYGRIIRDETGAVVKLLSIKMRMMQNVK
ncbi:sugar phosphate nucleotidyltransferase [Bacillus sp. SL00103]